MRLRDAIAEQKDKNEVSTQVETARSEVINIVNNFFYDKLSALPTIKEYMETFTAEANRS